jgi:hypothetical protein
MALILVMTSALGDNELITLDLVNNSVGVVNAAAPKPL